MGERVENHGRLVGDFSHHHLNSEYLNGLRNSLDELQQRRRHSAAYCFVPNCERVRVNGGAAPRVLQRRPFGHPANPLLSPARVFVAKPPGDPEGADSVRGAGEADLLKISRTC